MTDQKPNCSTCPHRDIISGKVGCKESRTYLPLPAESLIEYVGCLSHPDARKWLMGDVIKELERLYAEETTHSSSYSEGKADGYDRALTLIKDGVEK